MTTKFLFYSDVPWVGCLGCWAFGEYRRTGRQAEDTNHTSDKSSPNSRIRYINFYLRHNNVHCGVITRLYIMFKNVKDRTGEKCFNNFYLRHNNVHCGVITRLYTMFKKVKDRAGKSDLITFIFAITMCTVE